jgi:hypothetical protein
MLQNLKLSRFLDKRCLTYSPLVENAAWKNMPQKQYRKPGVVAHTCNPSYLGGRDQEDCGLRPAQAKKLLKSHFNKQARQLCTRVILTKREAQAGR